MKKLFFATITAALLVMMFTTTVLAAGVATDISKAQSQGILMNFFVYISNFGEISVYFIAFATFWCIDKKLGSLMVLSGVFATELCGMGKLITASTFPSNHAANATFSYGLLGYHNRKYRIISVSLFLLMVLVMFSKIYEGVHTPQDVIGGFLLTVLVIVVFHKLLQWMEGGRYRDIVILGGLIIFFLLCTLFFQSKINQLIVDGKLSVGNLDPQTIVPYLYWMTGLLTGTYLGWMMERRFVKFTTNVPLSDLITRFLTGWLAFAFINYGCSPLFKLMLGSNWGSFAATGFLGFYCIAIHPFLFTKLEKTKKGEFKC